MFVGTSSPDVVSKVLISMIIKTVEIETEQCVYWRATEVPRSRCANGAQLYSYWYNG